MRITHETSPDSSTPHAPEPHTTQVSTPTMQRAQQKRTLLWMGCSALVALGAVGTARLAAGMLPTWLLALCGIIPITLLGAAIMTNVSFVNHNRLVASGLTLAAAALLWATVVIGEVVARTGTVNCVIGLAVGASSSHSADAAHVASVMCADLYNEACDALVAKMVTPLALIFNPALAVPLVAAAIMLFAYTLAIPPEPAANQRFARLYVTPFRWQGVALVVGYGILTWSAAVWLSRTHAWIIGSVGAVHWVLLVANATLDAVEGFYDAGEGPTWIPTRAIKRIFNVYTATVGATLVGYALWALVPRLDMLWSAIATIPCLCGLLVVHHFTGDYNDADEWRIPTSTVMGAVSTVMAVALMDTSVRAEMAVEWLLWLPTAVGVGILLAAQLFRWRCGWRFRRLWFHDPGGARGGVWAHAAILGYNSAALGVHFTACIVFALMNQWTLLPSNTKTPNAPMLVAALLAFLGVGILLVVLLVMRVVPATHHRWNLRLFGVFSAGLLGSTVTQRLATPIARHVHATFCPTGTPMNVLGAFPIWCMCIATGIAVLTTALIFVRGARETRTGQGTMLVLAGCVVGCGIGATYPCRYEWSAQLAGMAFLLCLIAGGLVAWGSTRMTDTIWEKAAELAVKAVKITDDGTSVYAIMKTIVLCAGVIALALRFAVQLDWRDIAMVPLGIVAVAAFTILGIRIAKHMLAVANRPHNAPTAEAAKIILAREETSARRWYEVAVFNGTALISIGGALLVLQGGWLVLYGRDIFKVDPTATPAYAILAIGWPIAFAGILVNAMYFLSGKALAAMERRAERIHFMERVRVVAVTVNVLLSVAVGYCFIFGDMQGAWWTAPARYTLGWIACGVDLLQPYIIQVSSNALGADAAVRPVQPRHEAHLRSLSKWCAAYAGAVAATHFLVAHGYGFILVYCAHLFLTALWCVFAILQIGLALIIGITLPMTILAEGHED